MRTIRLMSTHVRWIVIGVVLLLVLGLAALYVFNITLFEREPKTWIVQPGEMVSLSADEVGPDDRYRCEGMAAIDGTPPRGTGFGNTSGIEVTTADDGTVTVICEPL